MLLLQLVLLYTYIKYHLTWCHVAQGNCHIYGDHYYMTFDRARVDFMGTCKYIAAETVPTPSHDHPAFKVFILHHFSSSQQPLHDNIWTGDLHFTTIRENYKTCKDTPTFPLCTLFPFHIPCYWYVIHNIM